jgi:hypothetical protein
MHLATSKLGTQRIGPLLRLRQRRRCSPGHLAILARSVAGQEPLRIEPQGA